MARKLSDYIPGLKGASPVQIDVGVDLSEILDANGNAMLEFDAVASAVNFIRLANAAAGNAVVISAQGSDTNVGLTLTPKGTGGVVASTAGATTTTALDVVSSGLTTGKGVDLSDANALTSGIVLHIASSATAITGAGRLVYVNHTGATGTSAILSEFASAANDETVVVQVTASAALALGVALKVSGAAVTTGTLLDISDNTAHTTGTAVNIVTNSANTGTRTVLNVKQDHASASDAKVAAFAQDSAAIAVTIDHTGTGNRQALVITTAADTVTSGVVAITGAAVTTGSAIKITLAALTTGSAIDMTGIAATKQNFNMNSSTGSTAAPQTNAPTGFYKIGIGGTDQWAPYYSAT